MKKNTFVHLCKILLWWLKTLWTGLFFNCYTCMQRLLNTSMSQTYTGNNGYSHLLACAHPLKTFSWICWLVTSYKVACFNVYFNQLYTTEIIIYQTRPHSSDEYLSKMVKLQICCNSRPKKKQNFSFYKFFLFWGVF